MKIGDKVRLKQPFQPELNRLRTYYCGIIAGFIQTSDSRGEASLQTSTDEVLLHLYDPVASTIYTDCLGVQALFFFRGDEVEPL